MAFPRYGPEQVAPEVGRMPRLDPNAPIEAFGGGASAIPEARALSGMAGGILADQMREAKQMADETALYGAAAKLANLTTDLLHNPDTGFLGKLGETALGGVAQVRDDYQKGASEIADGLNNDEQRAMFQRQVYAHEAELYRSVQQHTAQQLEVVGMKAKQDMIAAQTAAAVAGRDDPQAIEMALERQAAAVTDLGRTSGLSKDSVDLLRSSTRSKTNLEIMKAMFADGNDLSAAKFYEGHKEEFIGEDAIHAAGAVEEGSSRAQAQRESDLIMTPKELYNPQEGGTITMKPPETLSDALEEARRIENPKVRELTEGMLRQRFHDAKISAMEEQDTIYKIVADVSDKNPGTSPRLLATADQWDRLTPEHRDALLRRAVREQPNDDKAWLQFTTFASNPQRLGRMNAADFETQFWSKFDAHHRDLARNEWLDAQKLVQKNIMSPELNQTLSFRERINSSLRAYDPTFARPESDPAWEGKGLFTKFAQFEQLVARDVEEAGRSKGAPLSGEEIQSLITRRLMQRVKVGSDMVPEALIGPDEDVKVPGTVAADLKAKYENNGKRLDKDRIQRLYRAMLTGNRTLFDSILAEAP